MHKRNHCSTYLHFLLLFFLLFVFLKQAFHSLEWCTLNERQTQIRVVFQAPRSLKEWIWYFNVHLAHRAGVILVKKCSVCSWWKLRLSSLIFYTSGRLRRERNLYQKGKQRSNGKRGEGWKNTKITQANPQRVKLFFFERRLHKMYFMVLRTNFFVSSFLDNFPTLPYFVHVSITWKQKPCKLVLASLWQSKFWRSLSIF